MVYKEMLEELAKTREDTASLFAMYPLSVFEVGYRR